MKQSVMIGGAVVILLAAAGLIIFRGTGGGSSQIPAEVKAAIDYTKSQAREPTAAVKRDPSAAGTTSSTGRLEVDSGAGEDESEELEGSKSKDKKGAKRKRPIPRKRKKDGDGVDINIDDIIGPEGKQKRASRPVDDA